ncbi:AC78 [Alphabaculovirus altermyunipunctae]|jgi:hypothetical protein|uniref:AC78 n=1 Tax=Mythimna unipuncta nucleopolyhedrovirus TaxID=447897 RepID=A0A346TPL3_9ABAC|nr:AC78 [Mythimna unipuncta nucleopolyhedrovirus]AXU41523.1 AC78 [Mythimna unipuncta nucleopolyhedrovirus]
MNLEIPYDRLGTSDKVDYIPMKLAVNDDVMASKTNGIVAAANNAVVAPMDTTESQPNIQINCLMLAVVLIVLIVAILYILYYFFILRDRQHRRRIPPSYAL